MSQNNSQDYGLVNHHNLDESHLPEILAATVWRGSSDAARPLFGPLPARRQGDVLLYEWGLPARFTAAPGRVAVERTYVLLDVGVSFANPFWYTGDEAGTWYVDLVTIEQEGDGYTVRDLYLDLIVPTDGRPYRALDFDDFAGAIERGVLSVAAATDALRRWQRFIDRYLHAERFPTAGWADFPPRAIRDLAALPIPFAPVVYAP